MKEKVLEAFAELGFELTPMEELGFGFDYENIHMLFLPQANDDDFLNISIPGIYDMEEENPIAFLDLMNRVNSTLKYVKAYAGGDSLWLFYERELLGDEDLPMVISRMILHLESALTFARNALVEMKEGDKQENADESPDNE